MDNRQLPPTYHRKVPVSGPSRMATREASATAKAARQAAVQGGLWMRAGFVGASIFATGLVSLVSSADLLLAYLSWEVIGLCSYFLVGFWYNTKAFQDAGNSLFPRRSLEVRFGADPSDQRNGRAHGLRLHDQAQAVCPAFCQEHIHRGKIELSLQRFHLVPIDGRDQGIAVQRLNPRDGWGNFLRVVPA